MTADLNTYRFDSYSVYQFIAGILTMKQILEFNILAHFSDVYIRTLTTILMISLH